jgi:hypothetical protein
LLPDIRGSYRGSGLSDLALIWMIDPVVEVGQEKFGSFPESRCGFRPRDKC